MRSERLCICLKLKEFCSIAQEWMDEENETESLRDWYVLFKKLEYLLYDIGMEIYDLEAKSYDGQIPEDDDLSRLSPKEQKAFRDYMTRFQVGAEPFLFERYGDGYRAVLPYLLGRRAKEKIYYSPKRKYVVGVFENLLLQNQGIIKKMSSVTVLIVTCSPYKEMPPRDNDNADGHDIINIIRNYLMSEDDSGLYMNVFYDTRITDHYYTEVYVLPRKSYREILHCFQPQKDEKKTRVHLKKMIRFLK